MPRVKRGVTARARHKKVLKKAKGYYGARSGVYRVAKQAVTKAGQYAYRDRRQRKRQFRACGSYASMLQPMKTAYPIAGLSMA
jgi:large subunit ribosomal protein L20